MRPPRHAPRGQTLVVFALALTALLAMVGLVIDGGNAFAQQRRTQNGADAAAEAGAVQLARRMVGLPGSDAQWDQRVLDAVNATSTANGITTMGTPQYTKVDGTPVGNVGAGSIPSDASGVLAAGSREFTTFVGGVIGISGFTASAEVTAVTGYATEVAAGSLIPLALPLILTQCDSGGGSNRLVHPLGNEDWPTGPNNRVALPLCANGPGNVGWIDWDPPFGGASDVAASIRTPDGPPIATPKWYFVAETGGITSLDDDLDIWENKDLLLPIFDVEATTRPRLRMSRSLVPAGSSRAATRPGVTIARRARTVAPVKISGISW